MTKYGKDGSDSELGYRYLSVFNMGKFTEGNTL